MSSKFEVSLHEFLVHQATLTTGISLRFAFGLRSHCSNCDNLALVSHVHHVDRRIYN